MLLIIDNYDSFTFNLAQYFQQLNCEVMVCRNDEISLVEIERLAPQYLVISPGPCTPSEAGLSLQIVEHFAGKIPILGVCLGHQTIGQVFGAKVVRAKKVMHGKTSLITHNQSGIFLGLAQPLQVTRYHSLLLDEKTLPDYFFVTAFCEQPETKQKEIMAIAHKTLPIWGVQFHPESIMTQSGLQILQNFLTLANNQTTN